MALCSTQNTLTLFQWTCYLNLQHMFHFRCFISFWPPLKTVLISSMTGSGHYQEEWHSLIEPINPDISMQHIRKPFYLFESNVLWSLGTLLLRWITHEDAKNIPQVKQSTFFPYHKALGMQNFSWISFFLLIANFYSMLIYPTLGKACFVCEDKMKEVELLGQRLCSCCSGELPAQPQCLLEHVGTHILFDPMVDPALEPCRLCL